MQMVSIRKSALLEKFPMKFDFPVQSILICLRVIGRVQRKSDLKYYLVGMVTKWQGTFIHGIHLTSYVCVEIKHHKEILSTEVTISLNSLCVLFVVKIQCKE